MVEYRGSVTWPHLACYADNAGSDSCAGQGDKGASLTEPVDLSRLWEVADGDHAFASELAHVFLVTLGDRVQQLADALQAQDAETLRRVAHTLKGSSSNIGAEPIRRVAHDMEEAAVTEDFGQLPRLLARLSGEVERARRFLDSHFPP